jgi:hydrogenase 3 maturation protease
MADALELELRRFLRGRVVLVGIGNPLRGDDAFGPGLADRLAARWASGHSFILCVNAGPTPENHVSTIERHRPGSVLLVDCVDLGKAPGETGLLAPTELGATDASTHGFPLVLLMEELERRTGAAVRLLGVQPAKLGMGEGISPPVRRALRKLEGLLLEILG